VNGAAEHLVSIKARIVAPPHVVRWTVVREEAQGDQGLFRYRLTLRGGDLCEMFERFQVVAGSVRVSKYAFIGRMQPVSYGSAGTMQRIILKSRHTCTTYTTVQKQTSTLMGQSAQKKY
jgi:hypothetical protein